MTMESFILILFAGICFGVCVDVYLARKGF